MRAVSNESCTTPMMNPMATICMATVSDMPNSEQAMGIRRSEPPATPDAPHAPIVAMTDSATASHIGMSMPRVAAATMVMTVIVIAAPFMFIVAPRGMDTE